MRIARKSRASNLRVPPGVAVAVTLTALVSIGPFLPAAMAQSAAAVNVRSKFGSATVFLVVSGINQDGGRITNLGSGFIISDDGYVITAAHLLQDINHRALSQIRVTGSVGASFDPSSPTGLLLRLEVVRSGGDAVDATLLKLPHGGPGQTYQSVSMCDRPGAPPDGTTVISLSYPLGQSLTVTSGTLSAKDGPSGTWRTDALLNEGSSGGAVFDEAGHVLGLVQSGLTAAPGNYFILPKNVFKDLLDAGNATMRDCSGSGCDAQGSGSWTLSATQASTPGAGTKFVQLFPVPQAGCNPHCHEGEGDSFETSFSAPAGQKFTNPTIMCAPPDGRPECALNPMQVLVTGPRSAIVIGKARTVGLTYAFSADLSSEGAASSTGRVKLAGGSVENGKPFFVDFGDGTDRVLSVRSEQGRVNLSASDLQAGRLPAWLHFSGGVAPQAGQSTFTLEVRGVNCAPQ